MLYKESKGRINFIDSIKQASYLSFHHLPVSTIIRVICNPWLKTHHSLELSRNIKTYLLLTIKKGVFPAI